MPLSRAGEMSSTVLHSRVPTYCLLSLNLLFLYFNMLLLIPRHLLLQVEPLVQGTISALKLGKKAFRFTRVSMGSARPVLANIRYPSCYG